MDRKRGNRLIAVAFLSVVAGMTALSFAAIPLYRMFCQATGYGGTPNISDRAAPGGNGQTIRVRFNADVNPGLPWSFAAEVPVVTVPFGEDTLASYRATNRARSAVTGVALYNVTPEKAAKYFHKTACFCFNQQTLEAGETKDFPLSFWIDPALASNPNTADVHEVTLSYTFFRSLDDAEQSGALATAGPHAGGPPKTN